VLRLDSGAKKVAPTGRAIPESCNLAAGAGAGECPMKPVHLGLLVLSAFAARGDGDATRFRATLVGVEETPAIFAAGHATFNAQILGGDTRIDFTLTYEDLTAPPLAAHVHFGQRAVAGGVSYFLCGGGGKPACPPSTSGTISGTVVAADVVGPAAQGIAAGNLAAIIQMMRAGLTYANMHTPAHTGGEIRGQLKPGHHQDHDDD
jgi:hypothetical protein